MEKILHLTNFVPAHKTNERQSFFFRIPSSIRQMCVVEKVYVESVYMDKAGSTVNIDGKSSSGDDPIILTLSAVDGNGMLFRDSDGVSHHDGVCIFRYPASTSSQEGKVLGPCSRTFEVDFSTDIEPVARLYDQHGVQLSTNVDITAGVMSITLRVS